MKLGLLSLFAGTGNSFNKVVNIGISLDLKVGLQRCDARNSRCMGIYFAI